MSEGNRVSFDLDGLIALAGKLFDFFLHIFKPVLAAIVTIAGEGPVGFAVVFVIFFSLMLIRMSSRTANASLFGAGIAAIGRQGSLVSMGYLGVLAFLYAFGPLLSLVVMLIINSLLNREPGFTQFGELLGNAEARTGFIDDLLTLYAKQSYAFMPLGHTPAGLVASAFGSMWLVGSVISRNASR